MQKKGVVILVVGLALIVATAVMFKKNSVPVPVENTEIAATATPSAETTAEASLEAFSEQSTEETSALTEQPATEQSTEAEGSEPAVATTEEAPAAESATTAPSDDASLLAAPAALQIDVAKALEERFYGSAAAPVTIIEYASLTCPHCAHFTKDVLPAIKKDLIDTGKARLIYRDFPLDSYATKAAAMARCADHDKYFDLLEVIFKDQERWTRADDIDAALIQLGTLAGMDADYTRACMNNAELTNAIIQRMQDAQKKHDIKSTPTFIFNDGKEKFNGAQDIQKFTATVNKLSGGR